MKLKLSLVSLVALAAGANAQCLTATGSSVIGSFTPTGGFPADDEGVSTIQALGFTIDVNGTLYDHCYIGSNGMVELVVGAAAPNTWFQADNFGIGTVAELQGDVGTNPMFAPWSDDMFVADILVDTSVAGEFKITWVDASAYLNTDVFDFQCTLSPAGAQFNYGTDVYTDLFSNNAVMGATMGNVAGTGAEPESDFTNGGDTGTDPLLYELFPFAELPPDVLGQGFLVIPNGLGGFIYTLACGNPPASHTAVGGGCYPINDFSSVYQIFATGLDAKNALENTSLLYTPNGLGGYTVLSVAGTLRPTTGATSVGLVDESTVNVFLAQPFPNLGAPSALMSICDSGAISFGGALPTFVWWDTPADFNAQTSASFVGLGADLDPGASGDVLVEYDAGTNTEYVTFENVGFWDASGTPVGDSTFQFQVDLTAGTVTIVFGTINDAGYTGLEIGTGYCDATSANDMGGIDFATQLPYDTRTELVVDGVELGADVPAVSTATTGTTVTYSATAAPDFAPTALPGFKIGLMLGSFGAPVVPGIDLFFLGAPGCPAFVPTLDFVEATDPGGNFAVAYPAGIPAQTTLTFQMAFLFDINDPAYPSSLAAANGNTFAQTSNALVTFISDN